MGASFLAVIGLLCTHGAVLLFDDKTTNFISLVALFLLLHSASNTCGLIECFLIPGIVHDGNPPLIPSKRTLMISSRNESQIRAVRL